MAENSKIEWTHHTFNPWWGCFGVSPGCDNCYAERDAARFMPGKTIWGVDAARREFGDKHWNEPRKWDRRAAEKAMMARATFEPVERPRVFAASMADVFDKNAPEGARERLWALIRETPNLDWLLLTKRIGNAKSMLPADWGDGYPNAWLGASIVNQEEADRDIPKLLAVPARVRWLSMEPLLGPVSINPIYRRSPDSDWTYYDYPLDGKGSTKAGQYDTPRIDWVVAGGESGPNARPQDIRWPRKIRDQCAEAGVPFLYKQHGEWAPATYEVINEREERWSADASLTCNWGQPHKFSDGIGAVRVGKKNAGRLLDGVQHDGYPKVEA